MRLLRVCVLAAGLAVGLVIELEASSPQLDARFVGGVALILVCSLATFAPNFARWGPLALVTVALVDIFAMLLVFDLGAGIEVVEPLVAVPAIWLGVVLGRRGVVLAGVACTAFFVVPGLVLEGAPVGGWHHAITLVAFALVGSGGLAASAEMWDTQMVRLEQNADELKRALGVKDDFVTLVSHELRTPLTSIIGYLDLAMEEAEEIPGTIGSHLETVSRNADRLLVLVNDLLGAEQAERGPMHLVRTRTNVSSLVQLSLDDLALKAESAAVTMTAYIEPDVTMSADSSRILQVIDNLLSNAVKYTPPGGALRLTLRRRSGAVLLDVNDTGIGISTADQTELFTKFFRGRNATDLAIPGIGLGLMITKIIVRAHGGTISVQSEEGVGTSMRVVLPLEPTGLLPDDEGPDYPLETAFQEPAWAQGSNL
jgi:signal transduction histidine kinase